MQEKNTIWKFYTEPKEAWAAMLLACRAATRSIDLEQFIFDYDEIGQQFLDVCMQKAKEGVKVRILCDAAGSFSFFRASFINNLRQEGLEIVFFNSFIPGTLRNHSIWFFRDHRKLLVVDQKIGFTGSICLTDEVKTWRDTHVKIEGEVVIEMLETFNHMWERAHKRKYRGNSLTKVGSEGFNYVPSIPRPRQRFLYYRLIEAIRSAEKYIYLTTPYFVPDRRFLRVLELATRRGVEVKLLVPERSDHTLVDIAARSFFQSVLKSGIQIYQYTERMIHSKVAIIDDKWATIGSLNFDNVSFLYNFEANIVTTNKHFISELKMHFWADQSHSKKLELKEWNKRPFINRCLEFLILPIRKLL